MPSKLTLSDLSPSDLRARADECRTMADLEPGSRVAKSVLRLAEKYESMARKLEASQSPASIVIWERRDESYVAFYGDDFVLNVKLRADQTWEWVVRHPGRLPVLVGGMAKTVQEAMREAERSASNGPTM
jgi:hypothetical protein